PAGVDHAAVRRPLHAVAVVIFLEPLALVHPAVGEGVDAEAVLGSAVIGGEELAGVVFAVRPADQAMAVAHVPDDAVDVALALVGIAALAGEADGVRIPRAVADRRANGRDLGGPGLLDGQPDLRRQGREVVPRRLRQSRPRHRHDGRRQQRAANSDEHLPVPPNAGEHWYRPRRRQKRGLRAPRGRQAARRPCRHSATRKAAVNPRWTTRNSRARSRASPDSTPWTSFRATAPNPMALAISTGRRQSPAGARRDSQFSAAMPRNGPPSSRIRASRAAGASGGTAPTPNRVGANISARPTAAM